MRVDTDTIVIGAGPAGLALGATLRRHDVPFMILERETHVAPAWRRHYDRLHLHTPKHQSALPYRPFPDSYPRYPSRAQALAYFEDYARAFALEPAFGSDVRRCSRGEDGAWTVETATRRVRGHRLVIASGFARAPNAPSWPGQASFPGPVVHTADYVTGERFRGQRVLVVGFGNSGAEVALDLLEQGAAPTIAVRGGVNVVPRDVLGIPVTTLALATRFLPAHVADAMNRLTIRLVVGDLASAGLTKREVGPFVDIGQRRRIPVIDVGTLARIRSGEIAVRPGIGAFDGSDVVFVDGRREPFDAVVLATGFRAGLERVLADHPSVLDDGHPRVSGREASVPGLYFCGFEVVRTGLLRQIGLEARAIGADIAARARRDGTRTPSVPPPA